MSSHIVRTMYIVHSIRQTFKGSSHFLFIKYQMGNGREKIRVGLSTIEERRAESIWTWTLSPSSFGFFLCIFCFFLYGSGPELGQFIHASNHFCHIFHEWFSPFRLLRRPSSIVRRLSSVILVYISMSSSFFLHSKFQVFNILSILNHNNTALLDWTGDWQMVKGFDWKN